MNFKSLIFGLLSIFIAGCNSAKENNKKEESVEAVVAKTIPVT